MNAMQLLYVQSFYNKIVENHDYLWITMLSINYMIYLRLNKNKERVLSYQLVEILMNFAQNTFFDLCSFQEPRFELHTLPYQGSSTDFPAHFSIGSSTGYAHL